MYTTDGGAVSMSLAEKAWGDQLFDVTGIRGMAGIFGGVKMESTEIPSKA